MEAKMIGALLVFGGLLAAAGFLMHPENPAEAAELMPIVADNEGAWKTAHNLLGFGFAFTIVGLALLAFGPAGHNLGTLTRGGLALFAVGLLMLFPIVALEAGAVPDAAAAGNTEQFNTLHGIVASIEAFFPVAIVGALLFGFGAFRQPAHGMPKWTGLVVVAAALVTAVGGMTDNFTIVQYTLPVVFVFLAATGIMLVRTPAETRKRTTRAAA